MSSRERLRRSIRAWGFDRNPMRRSVDRVETAVATFLVVLSLVLVPLITLVVVSRVYTAGLAAEHQQQAVRHQVSATVLGQGGISADDSSNGIHRVVQVSWHDRNGTVRTATVPEAQGDVAGRHRTIWLDSSGRPTTRPRDRAQTISDTVLAGMFALIGTVLPLTGCRALVRSRLDRRRLAQWEADWARTAPLWIRHG